MCPSTAGAASPELKGPIAMLLDLGLDGAMIAVGMPSQLSVVGCWWNENELENCSSMFYNHFTQYFLCYTINAGTIDNEIADGEYNIIKYICSNRIGCTFCSISATSKRQYFRTRVDRLECRAKVRTSNPFECEPRRVLRNV